MGAPEDFERLRNLSANLLILPPSQRSDSNRRPAVYETAALPLSYAGMHRTFQFLLAIMLRVRVNPVLMAPSGKISSREAIASESIPGIICP